MRPLVVVCMILLLHVGLVASPAAASQVSCTEVDLPVTPHGTVHGQLCQPTVGAVGLVQLLVPGATYNRTYWDFPVEPQRYSYQRDMAAHGFTTFAIDRLGTGQSSTPPSAALMNVTEAAVVHQIVGHLRAGRVNGTPFRRVVLVGHSMGSVISTLEAATYHDVDAVILTGIAHLISAKVAAEGFATRVHPAMTDPQLRGNDSDPGYIATKPGTHRATLFHSPTSDPRVIAADEATKDQVSATGAADAVAGFQSPASLGINVPVLGVLGDKDFLFCNPLARDCSSADALLRQEAPYYSPAARFSLYVLPGAGHCLTLYPTTGEYREATRTWITRIAAENNYLVKGARYITAPR